MTMDRAYFPTNDVRFDAVWESMHPCLHCFVRHKPYGPSRYLSIFDDFHLQMMMMIGPMNAPSFQVRESLYPCIHCSMRPKPNGLIIVLSIFYDFHLQMVRDVNIQFRLWLLFMTQQFFLLFF